MPAKPDRRTERTRAALMSAFVAMVLADGYDAVTVERVAERANVGRSTFYMHYTGKEDILRQAMTRPSSVLAVLVGNELPPDVLVKQLEHFREQRARNHVFFSPPVRAIWVKALAGLIEPRLAPIVRHAHARPILPLPTIALQIAEAQIALITHWLFSRPPIKVEAAAEAMVATTHATLAALLRAPPNAKLVIPGEKLRVVRQGEEEP
ncbi:MAG TPA: TetR/AcrR family transcriptional regulator [Rhizomicrobium sp.]|jgi:AcrR family transcriptional regulator|nr:TetR/AcrR family transcriptional regulator [Rhizomicrobium sp.]